MRQLTGLPFIDRLDELSKLPMRQLTIHCAFQTAQPISKLPMRQLTMRQLTLQGAILSKLPMRQLTVSFCANSLILLELAPSNTYLTKILCTCQSP